MDGAPSLPWRRIVLDWWALLSFCPNIAQPPFYDAERAEELKWNVTGWNRDINEMSRLGGRGDSDAAKKFAVSSKNWMNPKVCPSLWKPPGIKPCVNPTAETPLLRATGRKWSRMEENPFWSLTTGFSHIWSDPLVAEGREDKPPALGRVYSQQNSLYCSWILYPGHPRDFYSCCWNKNQLPCVCYPRLSSSFVALLPEHINAFRKLISHKLLLGHVLRR